MNDTTIISNDITERLKEHITHQLNGTNIMLVIQKQLFANDLAGNQNRLAMPFNLLQTLDFLTPDEKACLDDGCDIDVPLLGPTLQMYEKPMKLVMWRINSTASYVLRTNWSNFVQENKYDLKQGATIQVTSFRKEDQDKLCLAIAVVKRAESLSTKPSKWQRFRFWFSSFAMGMKISCAYLLKLLIKER